MYPRLFLAKNLLCDDGVIFVHIDDNEVHNLRMIMNEIFGEENILAQFIWRTDGNFDNQAKVKNCHEYILAYCKNLNSFPPPPTIAPSVDSNSKLFNEEIRNTIVKNGAANPISKIVLPIGFPADFEKGKIEARNSSWPQYLNNALIENYKLTNETIIESGWSSKDLAIEFINNKLKPIVDGKGQETTFIISKTGSLEVVKKRKENQSHVVSVLTNLGNTQTTSANLKKDNIHFDYPKPIQLEKYLLSMNEGEEFIALDFFGGSGTLAHAVLEMNNEKSKFNSKKIKFILVQLPEPCEENTLAFKAECKTIADISKERIKKVIQKIKKEKAENPDIFDSGNQDLGFKVFKLSSSNFKIWRGSDITDENLEQQLEMFTNPVREGSEKENMLYELILKAGYLLTDSIEYKNKLYYVKGGELILALEEINQKIIDAILAPAPSGRAGAGLQKVITLDQLFTGNDQLKTNAVLQMKDAEIDFKTI
jgi:adenine-specific DNA-methyltransferase